MTWKPHVTVAAVIEKAGHFLCVEEVIEDRVRLNQPAGHLEPGESLLEAVVRETREETTCPFEPEALVGIYLWRAAPDAGTFLRIAFTGTAEDPDPTLPLDAEIRNTVWLNEDAIQAREADWRSPLVMRCVRDYLAGQRYPLEVLQTLLDV